MFLRVLKASALCLLLGCGQAPGGRCTDQPIQGEWEEFNYGGRVVIDDDCHVTSSRCSAQMRITDIHGDNLRVDAYTTRGGPDCLDYGIWKCSYSFPWGNSNRMYLECPDGDAALVLDKV